MLDPTIYTRNWQVASVPLHWKMLMLETGASHAPTFSKKTTHLLCPSRQGPKAEKALEWGIPVVDMVWLDGLLMSATTSPTTEDGVNPLSPRNQGGEGGVTEPEPTPEPVLRRTPFHLSLFFFFFFAKTVK